MRNFLATERLIHSLKTAIACGSAYLLARLIGQPADQWIVISVLVVMCAQIYVGSILQKSYLRLLGTLLGCLMATITIFFFKPTFIVILCALIVSSFIFSYIATTRDSLSQMGTLGAVTTIIILFGNPPSFSFAGLRFLEISIGIVIAALVSQFIFPIHARTHLRRAQAATLGQIRDYFTVVIALRFQHKTTDNSELDENIINSLLKQRQLAKESAPELMGKRFDPEHFSRTLYCEREILRAINFMDMALAKIDDLQAVYDGKNPLTPFNEAVIQALEIMMRVLKTNNPAHAHVHLPPMTLIIPALQQLPALASTQQRMYVDGFVFSAEILLDNLRELAELYHIPVSKDPTPE